MSDSDQDQSKGSEKTVAETSEPLEVSDEQLQDVDGGLLQLNLNPNQTTNFTGPNTNPTLPNTGGPGNGGHSFLRKRPSRVGPF